MDYCLNVENTAKYRECGETLTYTQYSCHQKLQRRFNVDVCKFANIQFFNNYPCLYYGSHACSSKAFVKQGIMQHG